MTPEEQRRDAARLAWLEIEDLREKTVVLKDWPVVVAELKRETERRLASFRVVFPDFYTEWEGKRMDNV